MTKERSFRKCDAAIVSHDCPDHISKIVMDKLECIGFEYSPRKMSDGSEFTYRKMANWAGLQAEVGFHHGLDITFFQDEVHDNPHGGKYDFNRESKMPYLIKLRYRKTIDAVESILLSNGIVDGSKNHPKTASEFIEFKRDECWHWPLSAPIKDYNAQDASGGILSEGQRRAALIRGRWFVGTVHYNLGNMWWFKRNENSSVTNIASFNLFPVSSAKKGRFIPERTNTSVLQRILKNHITANRFEQAAVVRDLLGIEVQNG